MAKCTDCYYQKWNGNKPVGCHLDEEQYSENDDDMEIKCGWFEFFDWG